MRTIATLAAITCFALTASPSLAASAVTASTSKAYTTVLQQTSPMPSSAGYHGRMTLHVTADGIINGWYVPEDAGPPVEVIGGKNGDQLWLEIGNNASLRIDGSMKNDGSIVGTAIPFANPSAVASTFPPVYSFEAKPAARTY